MPEYMTYEDFTRLHAMALMDFDAQGHLSYEVKSQLRKIQNKEIIVLDEGAVPPLEDDVL